jgi:ribonuclease P protein component
MNSFTQAHRLHNADEFSSVFVFRKTRVGKYFKLHYKPNGLDLSRLGFMVSKKVHKRANQRNYIKRTIREYFRTHQQQWLAIDLIVRSQKHFSQAQRSEVILELDQLCSKFIAMQEAAQSQAISQ